MDADHALNWLDSLVLDKTGQRLNDLQRLILKQVWQGKKYFDIALSYGCTEGHAKDVGSQLWKSLSEVLGETITKRNCRSVTERCLRKARRIKHRINSKLERLTGGSESERSRPLPHPLEPTVLNAAPVPTDRNYCIGRQDAIAHLHHLVGRGHRLIVIQGEGGLGKTTLAQHYLATHPFEVTLELLMARETHTISRVERVVEEWLKQDLGEEPGTEFGISLSRLKRHLQSRRVGILIDNLEPALDGAGCFVTAHRTYVELLRILGDTEVQSVTLVTSRDRLCESGINLTHYRLPSLEVAVWEQFFAAQGVFVEIDSLHQMHQSYSGNAKAMELLCGVILEDFAGEMATYWRLNRDDLLVAPDLRNLVCSQVDRLHSIDPNAYQLFCRMGCFRYQSVPRIPQAGLRSLLWDVPDDQRSRLITSLKNRSLIDGRQGEYSLHPALRAEAIARLRASPHWERANREAAQFWTDQVQRIETCDDALQALEAYYHYMALGDVVAAREVILKSRLNQWNQFLPLGSTLYRLGLLQPVLEAIRLLVDQLTPQHCTPRIGELYNILGDLQWITGQVQAAIASQQTTIQMATHALHSLSTTSTEPTTSHQTYYLRMLAIDSALSIGLYQIDLWELDAAAQQFQHVIEQAQHTRHHRWAEKAQICLALVQSWRGGAIAQTLADAVCAAGLEADDSAGRFAYFLQILGQTYVHLGQCDRANLLLKRALTAAEDGHYVQVQARALNALAMLHRLQHDWQAALKAHHQAIHLLDQLGAVCDLAEAHLQYGVTCQMMPPSGHLDWNEQSRSSFEQALRYFQEMNAPQQIERLMRLMQ